MKNLIKLFYPYVDACLVPFVYIAGILLRKIRTKGVQKFPFCKQTLLNLGIFPIRNHYYEPLFDMRGLKRSFTDERELPGIDWNINEQLETLKNFSHANELLAFETHKNDRLRFYFDNGTFEQGDAECWYQLIRYKKPKRIFEVGSGNSTLMATEAIKKNSEDDTSYTCKHICIEPYERPWLEKNVQVLRNKVEDIELDFFSELEENDILFIDSSHVIRPEGDVLYECLEILPRLRIGVIVHFHDIFTPRNYPDNWLKEEIRLWNEQYLLEAFLSHNTDWKIIAALNFLHHHHYDILKQKCPFLTQKHEPGSLYIQRT